MGQAGVVPWRCPREVFLKGGTPSSCLLQPAEGTGQRPPESAALNRALPIATRWHCFSFVLWLLGQPLVCWLHSLLTSVLCSWLTLICPFLREAFPGPPSAPSGLPLLPSSLPTAVVTQRARGQSGSLGLERRLAHGVLSRVLLVDSEKVPGAGQFVPLPLASGLSSDMSPGCSQSPCPPHIQPSSSRAHRVWGSPGHCPCADLWTGLLPH